MTSNRTYFHHIGKMEHLNKHFSKEELDEINNNYPREWVEKLSDLLFLKKTHEPKFKDRDYIDSDEYSNYLNAIDAFISVLLLSVTDENKSLFEKKIRDTIEGFQMSVTYNPNYDAPIQYERNEWTSSYPTTYAIDISQLNLNLDEIKIISFTLLVNQPLKIVRLNNDSKYKRRKICDDFRDTNLLASDGNIEYLILNKCNINKEGLKYLCLGLKINKKIQLIALRKNSINDSDVEYICELIKNNLSIVKIDLENNQIGNEGAQKLGKSLSENNQVKTLLLAHNEIDNKGAKDFSDLLKKSVIQKLSLDYKSYAFQNDNRNNNYENRIFVNKHGRKISVDNYGTSGGLYVKFDGEV